MLPTEDAARPKGAGPEAAAVTRRDAVAGLGATAAAALLPAPAALAADPPPAAEYRPATELIRALASREVSSRELVDACIARIEALDRKLNAVVVRDFDRARAAADAADKALGQGERRPLLGLPMTVKEQFNVVGLPTTWGFARFRGWHPDFDALAVTRLKNAGAIILGKTNVPTALSDWQSTNEVYGTTNNPWNLARTPGGSSGGAAAALAAGFVPLELGSDIGGSLRVPAHFCGVCAHKPSIELVPGRGAGPPEAPNVPTRGDMAVIGPMARSAADLALALDVLAGPDERWDGIGYRLALPAPRHDTLADFRVLVLDEHPLGPTADAIRAALDDLAGNLGKVGAQVIRRSPQMPDLARATRNYVELLMAGRSADLPPERRVRLESAAAALSPDDMSLTAAFLRGFAMNHAAWVHTARLREGLRARWQALFQEVDVILCPPSSTLAFPHDHAPIENRRLTINGHNVSYDDQIVWAAVATSAGLPATVVPIGQGGGGQGEGGLPVGVQIIGGYLDDRTTLRFAALVEKAYGGFRPPPAPA